MTIIIGPTLSSPWPSLSVQPSPPHDHHYRSNLLLLMTIIIGPTFSSSWPSLSVQPSPPHDHHYRSNLLLLMTIIIGPTFSSSWPSLSVQPSPPHDHHYRSNLLLLMTIIIGPTFSSSWPSLSVQPSPPHDHHYRSILLHFVTVAIAPLLLPPRSPNFSDVPHPLSIAPSSSLLLPSAIHLYWQGMCTECCEMALNCSVCCLLQEFREKNRSSALFNHLSGISESIPALGWVAVVCIHSLSQSCCRVARVVTCAVIVTSE